MNDLSKRFIALSIPNILANLVVPLASIVDFTVIGRVNDLSTVAAISVGSIIFDYLFLSFNFFRMGTTSQTVKYFSSGESEEVLNTLKMSVLVSSSMGIFIWVISPVIFLIAKSVLSIESNLVTQVEEYFYFRILGAPAVLGLMSFNGWYLGRQKAKKCLFITSVNNGLNILLTIMLVIPLSMGVKGAAIATAASAWLTFLLMLIFGRKWFHIFKPSSFLLLKQKQRIKDFFAINLSLFIRTLCLVSCFSLFVNLSANISQTMLVLNSILLRIFYFYSYFIDGFAFSLEALIGEFYHSANKVKMKLVTLISLKFSAMTYVLFGMTLLLFWNSLIGFINQNTDVILHSQASKPWPLIAMLMATLAFLMDGIFVGIGDSKSLRNSVVLGFLTSLIFFVIFKFFTVNILLWLALISFVSVRSIYLSFIYKKEYL